MNWIWVLLVPLILQETGQGPRLASGSGQSCPLTICYRKLQPGRKAIEPHVRRVVKCEEPHDCLRACDLEKSFACQGFNYRRGQAGENAGSCELTSTPYPRLHLHRDFVTDSYCDYYEREPNCQTGARGQPRVTFDQYPPWPGNRDRFPTIPSDKPIYAYEANYGSSGRPAYDDPYLKDTAGYGYGRRRDYLPDVPNANPADSSYYRDEDRRKVSKDGWTPLGPISGRSYGYRTNYQGVPGPRLEERSDGGLTGTRESDHYYGKFYNYGGGYGYGGDNYIHTTKDVVHEKIAKCSVRVGAGTRLGRGIVRRTHLARNLDHCESLCANERNFPCASFSYRYDVLPTDPTDNCLISDGQYHRLNFYTDLEPDRDYDIYAMIEDSRACAWKKSSERYPSDECFSRVRTGFSMPPDITKQMVLVGDLGECQLACTAAKQFLCRSFAFRYGYGGGSERSHQDPGGPNCLLSDWPSRDINPANMPDTDGAELYERSSVGRGCESYSYPFQKAVTSTQDHGIGVPRPDEACYSGYHRPCKLTPHVALSSVRADSEAECRRKCSRMRQTDTVPCMSFSFSSPTHSDPRPPEQNCLLTDVSMRDLRPGLDFTYDENHVLYSWAELDPRCSSGQYPSDTAPDYPRYPWPSNYQPDDPPAPPGLPPDFHGPAYETNPGPPGRPYEPDHPGYPSGPYQGHEYDIGLYYPSELSVFRRYTVNGQPCRNGTGCQRNEVAGFWSCEIEGAEPGAWDYCCEPTHRCGFSKGFHYPWCYVGPDEEQWRPCSETYQAYPSTGDRSNEQWASARHWPIIYLHRESPPNCNESFTPSNYRRDRSQRRRA